MSNKKSGKDGSSRSKSSLFTKKSTGNHHEKTHGADEVTCNEFLQGEFKKAFVAQFMAFREDAAAIAAGKFANSSDWKEKLGKFGLGTASVIAGAGIAGLGAAAIISALAASIAGVVVAVVGIALGIGVSTYLDKRKRRLYRRIDQMLQRDDIENDINRIAEHLSALYANQLLICTRKDAVKLGKSCFDAISDAMIHNKSMSFNELLHPVLLQGILMKSLAAVPKKKMELIDVNSQSANTRSMISKAALYCKETDTFYSSPSSKPGKYGAITFATKKELKEYKELIAGMQKKPEKWKYKKMSESQADVLRQDRFFKQPVNDKSCETSDDPKPMRSFSV